MRSLIINKNKDNRNAMRLTFLVCSAFQIIPNICEMLRVLMILLNIVNLIT